MLLTAYGRSHEEMTSFNSVKVKGPPPTGIEDNWYDCATKIGNGGWEFLFFGVSGNLHSVKEDGSFTTDPPPVGVGDD